MGIVTFKTKPELNGKPNIYSKRYILGETELKWKLARSTSDDKLGRARLPLIKLHKNNPTPRIEELIQKSI